MLTDNEAACGQVYNIAVGQNYSVNFLYQSICELLGADHAATYREPRAGDIHDSLADISQAKQLLGYAPTRQFIDGLATTVQYFKEVQ